MKYTTIVNNQSYEIEVLPDGRVKVNGAEREVDFRTMGNTEIYSLIIDNRSFEAVVEWRDGQYNVLMNGDRYEIKVLDERAQRLAKAMGSGADPTGEVVIRSPMPGLIVAVPVETGQTVKRGQTVVILESMKMENELKAPREGLVTRVEVRKGDSVEQNKALITIT
jgi:biotin carboxyl carrier protein